MNLMMRVTGALDLLLLAQMPPKGAESPNGVHRITLNETLPELCRPGPFKELVHAATACLMAHQPLPQDVLSSFETDQSPSCRGHKDFYQHSNFFNRI